MDREGGIVEVKREAVHLIESNMDLTACLSELMAEEAGEGEGECWMEAVQLAETLDISAGQLATHTLVEKILKGEKDGESAVKMANRLESLGLLERQLFVSCLLKSISKVALEVICCLVVSGHFSFHSLSSKEGEMSFLLEAFASKDIPHSLLQDVVKCLVCEVYPPQPNPTSSVALVTTNTLAVCVKHQYALDDWSDSAHTILDALPQCASIPTQTLKLVYFDLLSFFLSPSPPFLNHSDVITSQEKWKLSTLPKATVALFSKLLYGLDHSEIEECMNRVLAFSSDQVNWDGLLSLLVCYITSNQRAARSFRDYLAQLVAQATSSSSGELFKACLILARQASLEGAHVHPTYQRWFLEQFDTGHTSRKLLHFVTRQLTTLVPFEPAYCLEAHMRLPRFTSAQNAVGEYISLAQARLNELKVTLSPSQSQNVNSATLNHVLEMIEAHSKTGLIPSQVLQASLFQKPYFLRDFLPTLLSPSLPSPVNPSPLILALDKAKKIPKKMLECYHSKTASAGQSSLSTLTPPSFKRVNRLFQSLLEVAQSAEFDSKGTRLLSKLSTALSDLSVACGGRGLDWSAPDIPSEMIQLADLVVSSLCQVVLVETEQPTASQQTLTMLASHDLLHKPVLVRLWELIHSQMADLTDAQFTGVAALSHRLWLAHDPITPLYLQGPLSSHPSLSPLSTFSECCEALLGQLPHKTEAQMYATVKFASKFISCSLREESVRDRLGPAVLLAKLKYLSNRSGLLKQECSEVLRMLSQHVQWKTVHVSFVEWLKWELEIEADLLSLWERERYLSQQLFDSYLNREEDGVCFTMEVALCHVYSALTHDHTLPGYSNLIPLLQEICNSLPPTSEQSSLVKALTKALKEKIEDGVGSSHNHQTWLSAAVACRPLSHIPAHLFFSNSLQPDRATISSSLLSASQCLKLLMESTGSGPLMDTTLTHYICKGLLTLERTTDDQTLCQQFLLTSPIFFASLACSWPQLKHLFASRKPTQISNLSNWLNRCISGEIPSPPLPTSGIPNHVLASCLLKTHLSTSIPSLTAVVQTFPEEAVFIVVDFAVRLMSVSDSTQSPLFDIIQACTLRYPLSLCVCCSDTRYIPDHSSAINSSREEYPYQRGSSLQQLPVIFFKILHSQRDSMDKFLSSSTASLLLPVALLSHSECLSVASSRHSYQTLDPAFVELSTHTTKRFIKAASTSSLQACSHLSHSTLKPCINLHTSSITT